MQKLIYSKHVIMEILVCMKDTSCWCLYEWFYSDTIILHLLLLMLFKIHRIISVRRALEFLSCFQWSEIIGDLFENLSRKIYYPILQSDLRPAEDRSELTMVKRHAQLLEVIWKTYKFFIDNNETCREKNEIHLDRTIIWSKQFLT